MKLAIFGATGKTGQHLVQQALQQGHSVTALARTPSKLAITHPNLTVLAGDILDPAAVGRVVTGADAVISTLGPANNEATYTISRGMAVIIDAMKAAGVKRLVISAGAGVGDPNDQPKAINHFISFLLGVISKNVVEDMKRTVDAVRQSGLDWTIVRVPMLTDGAATGQIREGWVGVNTGARITRADMATYMLQQVSAAQFVRQAPMISN